MKKFPLIVLSAAVLSLAPGCFRQEVQTAEYSVPKMATPAAGAYIQGKLKRVPGLVESSYNLDARTVTVSYQSSTVRKMNFEEAIALAGFAVNDRPANPKAKQKNIEQGIMNKE